MKNFDTQIGAFILIKLKEKRRTISWLAREIDYDISNLRRILYNSQYIYFDLVYLISEALDEDLFAYGSQLLKET